MSVGAGLTLITGPTGGGKTALVVSWLAELKDRPIFTMGIPELTIDHQPVPPVSEWTEQRPSDEDPTLLLSYFTFPAASVVVIDEAQRVFRPRNAAAKVPPEVAAFETRRHTGSDFVLLTQAPHLLDSNIRKLVTRHIHIHDTFMGRYKLEWVGIGDPESPSSRELASRERYTPPPSAFPLYKSAELHTKIKRQYPWYIYLFAVCVPLAIFLAYYAYHRINARMTQPVEQVATTQAARPTGQTMQTEGGRVPIKTAVEYVAQYTPRLPGLLHTAPAYDDITKPVDAPAISGCIVRKKSGDCKCYDQQGNTYPTSADICKIYMNDGIFVAWRKTDAVVNRHEVGQSMKLAQSEVMPRSAPAAQPYQYKPSHVDDIEGGSHNFAGGLSEVKKPAENTFTLKPAG